MNEHKCKICDGDLVWVGNAIDGHLECPNSHQTCEEVIPEPVPLAALKDEEDAGLMYPSDHLNGRRSGRTHGMVLRALELVSKGEMVIILAHDRKSVKYIEHMILDMGADRIAGAFVLKNMSLGSLRVVNIQSATPRGYNRAAKVFADHAIKDQDRRVRDAFNEWWSRYEILT